MVVLIIEGCDLSGKSVAIEKIAKFYKEGFLLKNLYKPEKSGDRKIYKRYWDILEMIENQRFIILDRFFPSQAVYSLKRGVDEMNDREIGLLDNYCSDNYFIYVYLDTPLEELEERYEIRGDEHISKFELIILKARYEIFWKQTQMRKIKINTMKDDWLEELAKFVGKV